MNSNPQSLYDPDAVAASKLSEAEANEARARKAARPATIPGTRVCIDRKAATEWYQTVTDAMHALGIDNDAVKVAAFCDLAGVPD